MEPASCARLTPVVMGPGVRRDDTAFGMTRPIVSSPRATFFRQHQKLARARNPGPVAVKIRHQPSQIVAVHRPVQRGLVGELVARLMQRGIAEAPEPPGFFDAEGFCGVGKMLLAVPAVEGCPFGGIGDGGANDEIGCWHWLPPEKYGRIFTLVIPGRPAGQNPESRDCKLQIPGSALTRAPE